MKKKRALKPGALVTYLLDPSLYGVMEVVRIDIAGRLHCRSLVADSIDIFEAHEIELAETAVA